MRSDDQSAEAEQERTVSLPSTEDCEHAVVSAFRFDDPTHETFGRIALWGCQNCRLRFEPRAAASPAPDRGLDVRATAYFLFHLGYPYDLQVRDSDGDPVTPPLAVLDALIEEWRLYEVKPETDDTTEDYRTSFAIEIGRDPWEAEGSREGR